MSNNNEVPQSEKTGIERIRENVINAPAAVEAEFERTDNIWLDCFTSRIFQIEVYLDLKNTRESLTPQQYQEAERKLQELKKFHRSLLDQYPNKETVPPDEIKLELFRRLDILN
ncbi:MAG: hypothetical protein Q8Q89_01825 [bacterium]|nr:hypothetical protein [bacterium]